MKKQNDPLDEFCAKKKNKTVKKADDKIIGLDIDKMEYQQIVLSQSNFPDKFNQYD